MTNYTYMFIERESIQIPAKSIRVKKQRMEQKVGTGPLSIGLELTSKQ